jgi:hypothetical protein
MVERKMTGGQAMEGPGQRSAADILPDEGLTPIHLVSYQQRRGGNSPKI